jgi:hypothetical protein
VHKIIVPYNSSGLSKLYPEYPVKLLTKELRNKLPPLYANDGKGEDAVAIVKFFDAFGSWTWWASEFDGDDTFFGVVEGHEREFGYFSLSELESLKIGGGCPRIERDLYFVPKPLKECKNE